ncbi:MAG: hypothetical protein KC502_03875 [Myxococcales bacterium]|nr:hypothetical protein [Myxococcales bacterium]
MAKTRLSHRALFWHRVLMAHCLVIFTVLSAFGCGRSQRQAAEPMAVSDGSEADVPPEADAPLPADSQAPKEVVGGGDKPAAAGLWVVDAQGTKVGLLIQRGHPFQTQDGQIDILRDGVLVYSMTDQVFFGVEMNSGKVLVPRLGIADPQCSVPSVAGYYAKGTETSGMNYAFVYAGKWWRIKAGQPTELVQCAGVTKQGATPTCVLHSGTCRGFPVEKLPSPTLPKVFAAPLHFTVL